MNCKFFKNGSTLGTRVAKGPSLDEFLGSCRSLDEFCIPIPKHVATGAGHRKDHWNLINGQSHFPP